MILRTATILLLLCLLALPGPDISAHRAVPVNESWRWKTLATCHVDLHYPEGLEDLALKAAELAESGYLRVSVILGHEMDRIIPIVLYPAGNSFQKLIKAGSAEFDKGPSCHAHHPAGYVSFNGSYADLRRSITMETARLFQYAITSDTPFPGPAMTSVRTPFWLSEGIARYCAHGVDRVAYRSIRTMITVNRYRGLSDPPLVHGGSAAELAALGQAFCFYIEKKFGRETLGELLRDIRDLGFFSEAIHSATGMTMEDVDRDFTRFLMDLHRDASMKTSTKEKVAKRDISSHGPAGIMIPAASPDGKSIAALSVHRGRSDLVLMETPGGDTKKRVAVKTLFRHNEASPIRLINGGDNRISWSGDGAAIAVGGHAGAHPCVIVLDAGTGRVVQRLQLPFDRIRHPSISPDGRSIVFSAVAGSSEDIYLAELSSGKIMRITDDDFSDRFPSLSRDRSAILFLSNYNARGDPAEPDYQINKIDIKTGKRTVVTTAQGNYPISYGLAGSAILYMASQRPDPYPPVYHDPPVSPADIAFEQYRPVMQSPWLQLGLAGTLNNSYLGYFQGGFTDILGRHRFVVSANYLRDRSGNYANASLAYTYSTGGFSLDIGFFRRGDPLMIESLDDMVEHPSMISSGIRGMEHYGGNTSLGFGLGKSLSLQLGTSAGRYEKEHHFPRTRHNLKMTFGRIFMAAQYDATEYASMVPIEGFRGQIRADHTFDLTGNRSFTGVGIDLSGYIPLGRQFILALRGTGAMLIGPNRGNFQYYLGGFSSLRGYGLNTIAGRNIFIGSVELRFTPYEWCAFGIPRLSGLGNIGAVLFLDAGSAWNGGYRLIDKKSGRLDYLKLDFGFGLRAALSPLLILKLDFAWPFDNKSIKDNVILFSIGFDYR